MTTKKYRIGTGEEFITISLLFSDKLFKKIKTIVENEPDNNMSRFVEEATLKRKNKFKEFKKRDLNSNLRKKTFTFSKGFVDFIKKNNNMSQFVENSLIKNLNLDI